MFMKADGFRFVDIISYLGPGTNYETKSGWKRTAVLSRNRGFPTSGLITLKNLNYSGLPDNPAWYLRLKYAYVLSLSEFQKCKKKFKKTRMQTFADWLRYDNDLDVAPGSEAGVLY